MWDRPPASRTPREATVGRSNDNRFQDFFEEEQYVRLKNHLYNYLLRKRAIEGSLRRASCERVLEVGSGISPVMTTEDRTVYSDLSFLACRTLRHYLGNGCVGATRGWCVVADATALPFLEGAFSHALCSEVLEHVEDDCAVLAELARVTKAGGRLIVTFPHRRGYFANDDRYVQHYRRYELREMVERLEAAGFRPLATHKVLGPLDKLTMMAAVLLFDLTLKLGRGNREAVRAGRLLRRLEPLFVWANRLFAGLVWLDARLTPRALATCLLIKAEKR